MRILCALVFLFGTALAHGGRTATPGRSPGWQVFPTGGPTSTPQGGRGNTVTKAGTATGHNWRTWWGFNREWVFARRMRGVPVSGGARVAAKDTVTRQQLAEGDLYDVLREALGDKNHYVRSAAAVALGKLGRADAVSALQRRVHVRGEGWYDVREGAIYALGLLAQPDDRRFFKRLVADKRRELRERSMALVGHAIADDEDGRFELETHLKYRHSSLQLRGNQVPTVAEEEFRRFSAHLLGFTKGDDVNDLLEQVARGGRGWTEGTSGLAAIALGRRGARDSIGTLFSLMSTRRVPDVVKQCVPIALGHLLRRKGDEAHVARLADFAHQFRRKPVVRHFTVMALGRNGGTAAKDALLKMLHDRLFASDRERAFVYLALGLLGGRYEDVRERLLADYAAARTREIATVLSLACGIAGIAPSVPITARFLGKYPYAASAGPAARGADYPRYALVGLGMTGNPEAVPLIRAALKKYAIPPVRRAAATGLALALRSGAVDELVALLKRSGTQYTKAAVVSALGLIPSPSRKLVKTLIATYRHDGNQDTLRALAIIALGGIADPRPLPRSVALASGYNYLIRVAALDEIADFY